MITKENVITNLLTDELIQQTYVYSRKSKKYWKIIIPITIQLSTGAIISIPKGFEYDNASVPQFLWGIVKPVNDGLLASLIHDYLYINKHKHNMTQKQCDDEMLFWLKIINKEPIDNYIRYYAVRLFGWTKWNK